MHQEQEAYQLPNENREVVLYDQFGGNNSSLKFKINSSKKYLYMLSLTSFYAKF